MHDIDRKFLHTAVMSLAQQGHLVIREANQLLELLDYHDVEGEFWWHGKDMKGVSETAQARCTKYWTDQGYTQADLDEFNAA